MSNPNFQIYDQLLRFRLFQGMGRGELLQLAGFTKLGFMKVPADRAVAREGDLCRHLLLLVGGSLSVTTRSDDGGYTVSEELSAPWMVQPEALFGAQPRYSHTFVALSECHFITLSKDEVLTLMDRFIVFRLNLLNLLSTAAQRARRQVWRSAPATLRERFVRFVLDHSVYPAGAKQLHILMVRLAAELGDSRLDTSRMLNSVQADGLIALHRGRIVVPSLEKLLQHGQ